MKWDRVGWIQVLFGEFAHTIDDKGRVSLPAKFRGELGEKVVLVEGFENCLFVYPIKDFEVVAERLNAMSIGSKDARSFSRAFFSSAVDVEIDSHGRVLIPAGLRDHAGLEREAMIIGVGKRAEIWDKGAYEQFMSQAKSEYSEAAEKLVALGL